MRIAKAALDLIIITAGTYALVRIMVGAVISIDPARFP